MSIYDVQQIISARAPARTIPRLQTGDLISVHRANYTINVYADAAAKNFSFAALIFTALPGEMGIVLNTFTEVPDNILFHYVKVLFGRGLVGIVHSGLLENINDNIKTCTE